MNHYPHNLKQYIDRIKGGTIIALVKLYIIFQTESGLKPYEKLSRYRKWHGRDAYCRRTFKARA
jgi:hypothetical protein